MWVLTRSNNRTAIEAELAQNPSPNLHFVYFDLPHWARFWKKGPRGIHLYYYLWQVGAYFVARQLQREVGFDLVHHLTFAVDWIPSFLAFLPVPFVWGPIVGAQSADKAFRQTFSWGAKIQEYARTWVRRLARIDPFMRWAAQRTALGVASTAEAREHLLRLGCKKVTIHPSVGISSCEMQALSPRQPRDRNRKVRLLCVGRLVAFKGFSFVLKAFAEIRLCLPQAELWIIGDGPERRRLMHQAEQLGTKDAVRFWGPQSRQETLRCLSECDALVYLCFRGANSMACLEAMAAGLPVICLDLGGPALQVNEENGIKVPAISPEQVVRDLADAMRRIVENPGLRQRMGDAARKRVKDEFSWDATSERMGEIYREALAARSGPGLGEITWRSAQ